MVDDLMGAYGDRLVLAVAGVALALLVLVLILWLVRRRSGPAPFLRGGKNRQPRLQVLDAAAVDARRRIVLVRRDDVEHLVMIGGPTDIVIESGIRPAEGGSLSAMPTPLPLRREETRLEPATQPAAIAAPARRLEAPAQPMPQALSQVMPAERPEPVPARSRPRAERPAAPSTAEVPAAPVEDAAIRPRSPRVEPDRERPAREEAKAAPATGTAASNAASAVDIRPEPRDVAEKSDTTISQASPQTAAQPSSDLGAASDVLDAARRRVFQSGSAAQTNGERESRGDGLSPESAPLPTPAPPPATPARTLGSDFDRILEEEMASNLAADRRERPAAASVSPSLPRRDPAAPRITGAAPEPSLQAEVARIFGEMSVSRDER
ncbi:Flagellar biosynthesis protein, FliO [Rhizobium sp. RU35A]|uniref:flagellar biosynthetic protein FliO n=1 Tax=Rhizobium sp. RU35A TaxID=1907414 RepID=UPI0009545DB1|nr:flagellar biosynthetic protein FliO [Rhizobium sp. RU35A]SIR01132.1 Flagellar biosynthesis protein, FliO [Rhizobium sp. RU35A]